MSTDRRHRVRDRRAHPPRVVNWDQVAHETRYLFTQLPWHQRALKRLTTSGAIVIMAIPMAILYAVIGCSSAQALGKQLMRAGLKLQRHGF
jgi:hypothetical protein